MYIKAQSPAAFAEAYLVESIWNGKYAPGTILPAERELSEEIGVTRTTLREVLQRLARDGWLTIQHGKSTKVNDVWYTSGLNILETVVRLDTQNADKLVDNLLSARTNVATIYARASIKNNPQQVLDFLANLDNLEDSGEAYSEYDYKFHHALAMASNNLIYVLIINGFKTLYDKLGVFYFSHPDARALAKKFYQDFRLLAEQGDFNGAPELIRRYGINSGEIFQQYRDKMPTLAEAVVVK
ncbi:fatty acid metabolism transcriptional regulator FadR [Catenovulum agarivorans]|uniref:fatty acid metabolism transcriptional regulator FadR n=1 Tax=Catenovulum agarivorans TaxID=1172192 RepID=UPI0002ED49DE|nr:fatty acid metabolism transcriptional regulator FadR [Catenovulum agarivorans]